MRLVDDDDVCELANPFKAFGVVASPEQVRVIVDGEVTVFPE